MDWLIFPKKVQLARIDTAATAAAGGYNHRLKERRIATPNDGTPPTSNVVYVNMPSLLPAQVETDVHEEHNASSLGNVPRSRRVCIFNTTDFIDAGLIDSTTKRILLQQSDKLVSIHKYTNDELIELMADPPGLYVTMAKYIAFGFGDDEPNLVEVTFASRAKGVPGTLGAS